MSESDLQYYERRLGEETSLAGNASSAEAASVHRTLALIYAEEVRRLRPAMPYLQIVTANAT